MKFLFIDISLFFGIWAWKIHIYLKWERKKRENIRPFYRWDESIHQEPEQKKKICQAAEESFSIRYQDEEKGLAQIRSDTDQEEYWCNLAMCQCPEYKKTHKPCKHIYKIALEKELLKQG